MQLEVSILYFDKGFVNEDQIKNHVRHYVKLAEQGLKLVNENKYKEALHCLKEIRKTMKEEYKYYSKSKVQLLMWRTPLYNNYYSFIHEAFVNQEVPNAYRTLVSNLCNIQSYASFYFSDI
ncbi:hypothetical protein [Fictibacillus sp. JL2B1089]|uniref:hypothetical protein n=1 Tax=Fictibacillus sp. JL2B1089 TaxID=3399565 RepID=UPI003A88BC1A